MPDSTNKLSQFWQELRRRKVIKVIAMYAATAFIILEVVDIVLPRLGLPDWTVTLVIVLIAIGFPIAVIFSWIFDVTPEGLKKTESIKEVSVQEPTTLPAKKGFKISEVIIAVLFVAVCILFYPKIFNVDKFKEIRDSDGSISVAVMPFENLTGESSNDIWQKGISEYLINDLGSSEELSVISTQVMQEILGRTNQVSTASISPEMARETAGKLNVNTYITGKFIGSLNNTSILLNLVNSENGELVWSFRVEGDLGTSYLEVLGNLANTLRNYLEIKALEDEAGIDFTKAFTHSSEAYKHYINGLNALVNSNNQTARSSLIRALDIDSTFTLAAFYLAWVYYGEGSAVEDVAFWIHRAYNLKHNLPTQYQTWIDMWYAYVNKDIEGMLRACGIMESSDIQSRFYWFDLGSTYGGLNDREKALTAFRKVEALNESWNDDWNFPKYYEAYVRSLLETGRLNEMDRIAEKGLKIDPENRNLVVSLGAKSILQNDTVSLAYYKELIIKVNEGDVNPEASNAHDIGDMYKWIEDYQTAKGYFRRAYELDPGRIWSHYNMIWTDLLDNGDADKCLLLIDAELDRNPQKWQFLVLKGYALHKLDRNEEALAILTEVDDMVPFKRALIANVIRDVELAISREDR